jgi:methyl-accepting chemotaxis protein
MKKHGIGTQLVGFVLMSVTITVLTGWLCYSLLTRLSADSSALTAQTTEKLGLTYLVLERVSRAQTTVQQLLRQKDPDEMEKLLSTLETSQKEAKDLLAQCGGEGAKIQGAFDALVAADKNVADIFLRGDVGPAYEEFIGNATPQFERVAQAIHLYHDAIESAAKTQLAAQETSVKRSLLLGFSLVGAGLVVLVGMGLYLKSRITRPLERLSTLLDNGANLVAAASGQVAGASQTLAEGASEQAASLEETSASLEEISSMTRRNAENAQSAKDLATQTRAAADAGTSDMREMNEAMDAIKNSGDNIAKIIKTIDEIAFQTNILALNAAVEAARAGEAGMGFAVVAEEVRNLAQRSAQAAKETAAKIEDSISRSEAGVEVSRKVAQRLDEIVTRARDVDELVAEIATASREQSQGIDQVNIAVTEMDKVTQNNAASAEESASASHQLNTQAAMLKEAVAELQGLIRGRSRKNAPAKAESAPRAGQVLKTALETDIRVDIPSSNGATPRNGRHVARALPSARRASPGEGFRR